MILRWKHLIKQSVLYFPIENVGTKLVRNAEELSKRSYSKGKKSKSGVGWVVIFMFNI